MRVVVPVVLILAGLSVGCPAKPAPSLRHTTRGSPSPASPTASSAASPAATASQALALPVADGHVYVHTTWPGGRQPRVHRPAALRAVIHAATCSACVRGKVNPSTDERYGRWDGPFTTSAQARAQTAEQGVLPDLVERHGCISTPSSGLTLRVGRSVAFCPRCQKRADQGLIENVGECGLRLRGCTTKTSSGMIQACGNCASLRVATCTMCLRPLDWHEVHPRGRK